MSIHSENADSVFFYGFPTVGQIYMFLTYIFYKSDYDLKYIEALVLQLLFCYNPHQATVANEGLIVIPCHEMEE